MAVTAMAAAAKWAEEVMGVASTATATAAAGGRVGAGWVGSVAERAVRCAQVDGVAAPEARPGKAVGGREVVARAAAIWAELRVVKEARVVHRPLRCGRAVHRRHPRPPSRGWREGRPRQSGRLASVA